MDVVITGDEVPDAGAMGVFNRTSSGGAVTGGTNYKIFDSGGTETSDYSRVPYEVAPDLSITLEIQNISADGSIDYQNDSYYNQFVVSILFHPSSHASCASATTDGVSLSGSSLTLEELHATNAEKTYTVVLDTDPGADVVVTVTSADTSAVTVDTDSVTAGAQSRLTFTHGNSGNWSAAQTVTLRAVNDGDAAAESVMISHAAAVADTTNPSTRFRSVM